jgi:hypothetical protein
LKKKKRENHIENKTEKKKNLISYSKRDVLVITISNNGNSLKSEVEIILENLTFKNAMQNQAERQRIPQNNQPQQPPNLKPLFDWSVKSFAKYGFDGSVFGEIFDGIKAHSMDAQFISAVEISIINLLTLPESDKNFLNVLYMGLYIPHSDLHDWNKLSEVVAKHFTKIERINLDSLTLKSLISNFHTFFNDLVRDSYDIYSDSIRTAVKTAQFLYELNNPKKISISEYYSHTLSDKITMEEEFEMYTDTEDEYDFCFIQEAPFLMDITLKQKYFELVSESFQQNSTRKSIVKIRRSEAFNHSVKQVVDHQNIKDYFKFPLQIEFIDEQGIDLGGLVRDFFRLLSNKIFVLPSKFFKQIRSFYWFDSSNKMPNL